MHIHRSNVMNNKRQTTQVKTSIRGQVGGHRGVLPPSGFGPPLILPLSNHCLPHFLIFELELPASKILNPLVEKFLTPKLKKIILQKRSQPPS